MMMMENGQSTKRESDKSLTLKLSKSKGSHDRKSFTFGRSSKNKSTGIIPPTSIACQSSGSLDESKENNSIDGESITSKDTLPSEEKFSGQGITFKAKLIGVDPVTGPRGDKMCQSALQRLKALIKETGSHKQRIVIKISLEGVTIKDEKSGESISSYSIPLISYIARDASDKRAFGFVYGSPDTGHQFIGIKTEKSAIPVMKTIGELFTYVYEQKKRNQSVDSGTSGDATSDGDLGPSSIIETNSKSLSKKLSSNQQEINNLPPLLPPPRNESAASDFNGNVFTANFDDAFVNMSNLKELIASAKQASDPYATWESFDDDFASLSLDTSGRSKPGQKSNQSTTAANNLPVVPSPPRSPGRTRELSAILKIKPPVNTSRKNRSGLSSGADSPSSFTSSFTNINDPPASPAISSLVNSNTPGPSSHNGVSVSSNVDHQQHNTSSAGDRYAVFSEINSMTSSIFDELAEEKKKQEQQETQYHHQQQLLQQQQQLAALQQQLQLQQLQLQQQLQFQQQLQLQQQQQHPSACNSVIESLVASNRSVTPQSIDSRSSRSPSSLSNPRFSELSSSSNARFSPYCQTESFINPSLENLSPLPPPRPPPREFHDNSNSSQSTSHDGSPPPPVPPKPMKSDTECDMRPPPLPKRKPSNPNNILSSSSLSMISGELGAALKLSTNPFYDSLESKSFGSTSVQPPERFAPPLPAPQRKLQSHNSSLKGYNVTSTANDFYVNNRQLQSQYQKLQQSQQLNHPNQQSASTQLSITPTTSMVSASSSGMYDPFDFAFITNTLQLTDSSRTSNNIPSRSEDRSSSRPGLTTGSFSISQTPVCYLGDDYLLDNNNSLSRSVIGLDEAKLSRGSSYSSDSLPAMRLNLSNSYEASKNLERFSTPLSTFSDSMGKPFIHHNHQVSQINPNEGLNLNSSGSYSICEPNLQNSSAIKSTPQLSQISNITRITPGFIDSFTGEMSFNTSQDANNSIFEPWKALSSLEKSNSLTEAILRSSPAPSFTGSVTGIANTSNNMATGLGAMMMTSGDPNQMTQTAIQQQQRYINKSSLAPNNSDLSGRNPSPFNHFGVEHVSPPERNIFRKENDPFADDFFQPDTSSS